MQEIEVKILEIDVPAVIKRLEELGARKVAEGEMKGIFFKPQIAFENGETLRLRQHEGRVELTLKRPVSREGAKIMEEQQVVVDDYERMQNILIALGFAPIKPFAKHRVSYTRGDVHYEFDTWPEIPTLLEIEAPDMEALKNAIEELGFSMADTKPWGGKDVLKHYGK